MKLSDITATFVQDRYNALLTRWGTRNSRMDEYEKIYKLDLWTDDLEPDERRVAVPTAWTRVEAFRALLLTRPPVISVPSSSIRSVAQDKADVLEKYLYAVWDQAQVMDALNKAEWGACCLGEGVIRCLYDDNAVEDELPLLIQAIDPRTVFAAPSGKPGIDAELCYVYEKARREIELEWGVQIDGRPTHPSNLEAWLDEEVEFVDYWRTDIEQVEVEIEPPLFEPKGSVEALLDWARQEMIPPPLVEGEAPEEMVVEQVIAVEPETKKVNRRVITNAILVGTTFVKEPVRMPGYNRIPFIRYAGIPTGLPDEDGALSVLFPITGGANVTDSNVIGLSASISELLAMKQRLIEMFSNGAIVTDDEKLDLDFTPGSINYIGSGKTWHFLVPPGPLPQADGQIGLLERQIEDATLPSSMMGRYEGALSGIALSTMTNPTLMKIASRQQGRERAYQTMNSLILSLTEFYAVDGWDVWGTDSRSGEVFELEITPDDIGGYYRNRVQLSASLPKDEAGEIMTLTTLGDKGYISRETVLDQIQRIKRLSSQSPMDEMKKVLRDRLLFEGPLTEALSKLVVSEYNPELAQILQPPPPPPQPQGPPTPQGPQGPMMGAPGAPMGGMPPSVMPPQAVPEAMGAQGTPEGMAAMMQMMGQGPPRGG